MSIYASGMDVGMDEDRPTGEVLVYRGSHMFPEPDDIPAAVLLSSIPGHCVPGQDDDDFDHVAAFLRLDVMQRVDGHIDATVVLTEDGARTLRERLDEWLTIPKLHPTDPSLGATPGGA